MNQVTKENERKNLHEGYWWLHYPELWQFLEAIPKDACILDLGCGSGVLATGLLAHDFTNITLSDREDIRSYEQAFALPFYKADLNFDTIPLSDGSIDVITATNLIEHLENPFYFLRQCERLLKPHGKLILTMYIGWNIWSRLLFLRTGLIEGYHNPNYHISFLPKNILQHALKNFALEQSFYQQREALHIKRFRIPLRLPRGERWSAQGAFLYSKK